MNSFYLFWSGFIIFTLLTVKCEATEASAATMLRLRDSVTFSYSLSNTFLDFIRGDRPPTVIMEVLTNIQTSRHRRISYRTLEPVITSYAGYAACVIIGLLFAILMPLTGLIFCCARCCGKCGGRTHLVDSKKDPCRRVTYSVFLAIIITIQLVAVVTAFINHFLGHEALVNKDPRIGAISQFNLSLHELESSLNEMLQMAKDTSSADLGKQKQRFFAVVDGGLLDLQENFTNTSKAKGVIMSLSNLQTSTKRYTANSESMLLWRQFNDSLISLVTELPSLKNRIVNVLNERCPVDKLIECKALLKQTQDNLSVRYAPEMFHRDGVQIIYEQVQRHLTDIESLSDFGGTLGNLTVIVRQAIDQDLERAWNDLAQSPETRQKLASVFEIYVNNISYILDILRTHMILDRNNDANLNFLRTVEYRMYAGIALLCIPILILLLMYLGLCFGTCGARPYEEAGVCNRGVGANLLLAGVGFIFLFSTILMLVCIILFVLGGPLQTEFCRYMTGRYPDGPRKMDQYVYEATGIILDGVERQRIHIVDSAATIVDSPELDTIRLVHQVVRANLADAILTRCEHEPFVKAISGGQLYLPILTKAIDGILTHLIESFKRIDLIVPLDNVVQSSLESLERVKTLSSVNFTRAIRQASTPLTHIDDLTEYVNALKSLQIDDLDPYVTELLNGPVATDHLREEIQGFFIGLHNMSQQFLLARDSLLTFRQNLPASVQATMNKGLVKLQPLLVKELQLAVIATWHNIPCRNLRLAAKRSVDSLCYTSLMPLNSFWAALGFTLLLFIPAIILAVKLAGLYRKTEKYSSDYEEPDYISYHGFYMRPSSDYQVKPQKPRKRNRKTANAHGYMAIPDQEI